MKDPSLVPKGRYAMMANFLEYPMSRGSIHITSRDVYDIPDFDAGFLTHPGDLAPHIFAYKKNREIMRRMGCVRREYEPSHPAFPTGSTASCSTPTTHDIVYSEADDIAIEMWVRAGMETTWHSMYTSPHMADSGVLVP
jgi:alcohol oxidase